MERHQIGRPAVLVFVSLLAVGAQIAGCGAPPAEKPTASRPSRPETAKRGKASKYAPPIARQEGAPPAETPVEKPADTPAPEKPETPPATEPAATADSPTKPAAAADAPLVAAKPAAPARAEKAKPAAPARPAAPAAPEFGQAEPLDLIMPQVLMTDGEAKTCRVKVGDVLPDLRLPELNSGEVALSSLYGKRMTVVLFWRASHAYDVEELGDLERLVAARFKDKGVNVVGIDVKDPPEAVKEAVTAKKVQYPTLLDSSGTALAEVATGSMPRTFLVDASGKILWFDMEYSRSTRRDLLRAIRATLTVNE